MFEWGLVDAVFMVMSLFVYSALPVPESGPLIAKKLEKLKS
jgi:hypothetical protein